MRALCVLATACASAPSAPSQGAAAAAGPRLQPAPTPQAQPPRAGELAPESPLLAALRTELARGMQGFGGRDKAPYFAALQALDVRSVTLRASHGKLVDRHRNHRRTLGGDVRVGDHQFDSTHGDGQGPRFYDLGAPLDSHAAQPLAFSMGRDHGYPGQLPIDDDVGAIRVAAWRYFDAALRGARRAYAEAQRERTFKASEDDPSADFSRESPATFIDALPAAPVESPTWVQLAERLSAALATDERVLEADVSIELAATTRFLVTSEGTRLQTHTTPASVALSVQAVADDGMRVDQTKAFHAPSADRLPSADELLREAHALQRSVLALRVAPLAEPYSGPAILESRAAAVFFHEVLGHRLEAQRQRRDDEGQTFAKKLGQLVLPTFLSVYDDPTLRRLGDVDLAGHYDYDSEGVAAQRALLVDDGVLRGFLLGRKPTRGFDRSNGHGRGASASGAVARQANLMIEASERVPASELRRRLIDEVRKQGKPYGLRIEEVDGGFTLTGRHLPQAFKVRPVLVYRVPADGSPDVLVRGADVVGTPLVGLSKILAAGDDFATFNGVCGAESGPVPVSASSPSILIGQVEIELKEHQRDKPPLLPAPKAAP